MVGGSGLAVAERLIPDTELARCEGALNFLHLVLGVVLPTWLLLWSAAIKARPNWYGPEGARSWPGGAAVHAVDAAVRRWFGCGPARGRRPGRFRLFVEWWLLLGLLWAASVAVT